MKTAGIVLCGGHSSRMGTPKAWLPFGGELMLPRVVRVVREAVGPVVVVAAPGQDVPPLQTDVMIVRDEEEGMGPLAGLAAGLAALEGTADAVYLSSCDVPFLRVGFVRRVVELLGRPMSSPSPKARGEEIEEPTPSPSLKGGEQDLRSGGAPGVTEDVLRAFTPSLQGGGWGVGSSGAGGISLPSDALACVPRVNGRFHPLAGAYRIGVLPAVRAMLADNALRLTDVFGRVWTRVVEAHDFADADPVCDSLRNVNTPEEYEAARKSLS